jgi:polysaccharide pyruvyl transferase WcaK-like protein
MNVLVLGWYHHRNAGDDRMQHVLTEWLEGNTLGFLPAGRPLPPSFARRWDAVLIGGGGVLQARGGAFRDMARWIRRARVPVALVGVSAEAAPADLVAEVRGAADRCCFLWFRDRGSVEAMGVQEHANAFVGPDLTWMRPLAADERALDQRSGVAVAVAPHAGLDEQRWSEALAELPGPRRPWPFWVEGGADQRALARLLPGLDLPEEHHVEPAGAAATVVSARYHGLVFGLQLGRPVVGIGDAPKVRRFLAEQGLEDWWVPADRPEHLAAVVAAQHDDLEAAGARAAAVRGRLVVEAQRCGREALERLEAAARPLQGRSAWRRLLP